MKERIITTIAADRITIIIELQNLLEAGSIIVCSIKATFDGGQLLPK
jgi:hypothetical protein